MKEAGGNEGGTSEYTSWERSEGRENEGCLGRLEGNGRQ